VSVRNPGRQPHAWGEAAVAHLRQRWEDGAGTALIGTELGVSKSAVVGKAHRLNLPARPSPIRAVGQTPVVRPRKRPTLAKPLALEPAPAPAPEPPPREPVVPRGCLYPRGNRPHWDWCGAPVVDGGPYCEPCRRRCWIVPPRRVAA
jgi:GcrA cell cycle regulator